MELIPGRQLAVDQQIAHLEERAVLGQLFDGEAAIAEDALLAIDEGDLALAAAGVAVARVHGDETGFTAELLAIDGAFAFGALNDVELDLLAVVVEFCRPHPNFLPCRMTFNSQAKQAGNS